MLGRNRSAILLLALVTTLSLSGAAHGQARSNKALLTLTKLSEEFEGLTKRISPAVVRIIATGYSPTGAGATALLGKQRSTGSGVVLDPNGFIVTNAHVVEGARRTQVVLTHRGPARSGKPSILTPRGRIVGAQIVGIDRETDLAVLRVQETNVPFLSLGDSDEIKKGQVVLAFGSPLGLENSVSMGVVSAVARQLRPEDPMIYVQTDAPINPGNSGGPLVDTKGHVVGINTLIFSQSGGSEGIGFSAPSNIVKNIYQQLKEYGRVRRGQIGADLQTVTPLMAEALGLQSQGRVIVSNVEPHGAADNAGLRVGDVIHALDGKNMENGRQFEVNLYRRAVGDYVLLEIQRGTVQKTIKIEVTERPDDPGRFSEMVTPERNLVPRLGLLCLDLDDTIRRMLPRLRIKSGAVIANRTNLFYEGDQFQPGDVIHSLNNQAVTSVADLKDIVSGLRTYDAVVAQIERLGEFMYVSFELE